jgi:hypothetical protein
MHQFPRLIMSYSEFFVMEVNKSIYTPSVYSMLLSYRLMLVIQIYSNMFMNTFDSLGQTYEKSLCQLGDWSGFAASVKAAT